MQYAVNVYQPPYMGMGVSQQMIPQQMSQMLLQCNQQLFHSYNLLEQLQGLYEMDTVDGRDRINILRPVSDKGVRNMGCTIVRRVSADGEALSDQMILEVQNQFILCAIDQEMLAYTSKNKDMRKEIIWTSTENAEDFRWKRSCPSADKEALFLGKIQQNLSCTSLSSGLSMISSTEGATSQFSTDSSSSHEDGQMTPHQMEQEENLFDMIKTYCSGRPNLLKKVVQWGLSKEKDPGIPIKMNPERIKKLAHGRMWVSCMLADAPTMTSSSKDITPEQDAVDNLKGAYQEEERGSCIYVQPKPEASQPGLQHRLRKENNFWLIEECDSETRTWKLRAKELPRRNWLDVRNMRKPLRVKLIPLTKILARMSEDIFDEDIEKQMDFLFNDCNQKKLNTKVKKRNLKHNMQNLKAKLEKQHCLSFAVRVVNVADGIAREHGIHE